MSGMNLSVYMKGDYEDLRRFGLGKNKANLFVMSTAYCVLRYGFVIPV